jgi:flagellar basal body-associated protein FliL
MSDKKKEEITKRDRFKIWVYIGFAILGILLVVLLIGLFYYLFSSSSSSSSSSNNNYRSNTTTVSSSTPKATTSSLPIMTSDRSTYMSSLFRRGGGFKNRLKRY